MSTVGLYFKYSSQVGIDCNFRVALTGLRVVKRLKGIQELRQKIKCQR